MTKTSLAGAVSVLCGLGLGSARAADVPPRLTIRLPPIAVPYYDWSGFPIGAKWVLGIDADWPTSGIASAAGPATPSLAAGSNWAGSATARIGIAWDRWLVFGKGGAAWAASDYDVITPADYSGSAARTGWTVGGGVELGLFKDWSVKAEYDYIDLGTRSVMTAAPASTPADTAQVVHMLKLGANYRFDWR